MGEVVLRAGLNALANMTTHAKKKIIFNMGVCNKN